MSTMNTYSGRKFPPMEISAENIYLEDIAHALSLLCRGGGHIKYFYSVGQHSINCANEAKARGWSDRLVLACLLHDASEAYISDIIRPVKVHLSNYLEIENMMMQAVLERFGLGDLTEEENRMWKQIDDEILDNELKVMMPGEKDRNPAKLASTPVFEEKSFAWVEQQFLGMAKQLLEATELDVFK